MVLRTISLAVVMLGLAACQSESDSTEPAPPASAPADAQGAADALIQTVAFSQKPVEVGCGMCIYKMDGVDHCVTAAVVDGTPHVVTGAGEEAHGLGLCSTSKQAMLTGRLEDGMIVSETLELQ